MCVDICVYSCFMPPLYVVCWAPICLYIFVYMAAFFTFVARLLRTRDSVILAPVTPNHVVGPLRC